MSGGVHNSSSTTIESIFVCLLASSVVSLRSVTSLLVQPLIVKNKMNKLKNKYILFFFIVSFILPLHGQYLPKDGAKLNYNQIYFESLSLKNAIFYTYHIAYDSTESIEDFSTYSIKTQVSKTPFINIESLKFGKKYKWYVETKLKNNEIIKSDIHFFSLFECPYSDTTKYKFKQHYNSKKNVEDGIIWLDQAHCAVNRKLEVVWFLAPIIDDFKENKQIRDFRVYQDGTISFISDGEAYHINKDLDIIWKAPNTGKISGEKKENYHHSFEKMSNGNYIVLGNQYIELEKTDTKDTSDRRVEFTTIIEYNQNKEVVWSWKLLEKFALDLLANPETNFIYNTHCNSLSVSKDGKKILLGFRDISRIIEIDKKSGAIVRSFGKKLNKTDTLVYETDLFMFPHDAKYIDNETISVLNNNDVKNKKISSLIYLKLPDVKAKNLTLIWRFQFDFDRFTNGKSSKMGNHVVLPNNNLLINEGSINRIVEIDPIKKNPLWDLIITKNYGNSGWSDFSVYRVFYTKKL